MFRTFDEVIEMANHASAEKAAKQAIRKRNENLITRSKYKAAVKKLRTHLLAKPTNKEEARKQAHLLLDGVQRVLTKAASKNLIKKRTASRYVARLSTSIHRTLGA
jgi:ribosomal protein S20